MHRDRDTNTDRELCCWHTHTSHTSRTRNISSRKIGDDVSSDNASFQMEEWDSLVGLFDETKLVRRKANGK